MFVKVKKGVLCCFKKKKPINCEKGKFYDLCFANHARVVNFAIMLSFPVETIYSIHFAVFVKRKLSKKFPHPNIFTCTVSIIEPRVYLKFRYVL